MKHITPRLAGLSLAAVTAIAHAQSGLQYEFHSRTKGLVVTAGASAPAPALTKLASLSSTALVFDAQPLGGAQSKFLLVINDGTGSVALEAPQVQGSAFSATTSCSATLAAGQSCAVSVTFSATSHIAQSGVLTVGSNASNGPLSATLFGTTQAPASLALPTEPVSFGVQAAGTSRQRTVTVTNTGQQPAAGTYVALTGPTALSLSSNTCGTAGAPVSLPAGASCSVTLVLTSQTALTLNEATLTFHGGFSNSGVLLAVTGEVLPAPSAVGAWSATYESTSPPVTAFAGTAISATSAPLTVFLRNTSNEGTLSSGFALSGDVTQFRITAVTRQSASHAATQACETTIAADGQSASECTATSATQSTPLPHIRVQLAYAPTVAGNHSVQLAPSSSGSSVLPSAVQFTGSALVVYPDGYITRAGLIFAPPSALSYSWSAATGYCQTATLNGLNGWRIAAGTELDGVRSAMKAGTLAVPNVGGWSLNSGRYKIATSGKMVDFTINSTNVGAGIVNDADGSGRKVVCVRPA
jgi:hypothetical protein